MLATAKARVKAQLFQRLPMMPIAESVALQRHRRGLQQIRRQEDAEVERALQALKGPVRARLITVIATYRRPMLVSRAVTSALEQDVSDHRVLVVDDAGGQVPRFDDPRVHVITLAANIGICGVVRNVGIRASDSAYLAFLDDDNHWTTDHIRLSLATLSDDAAYCYSGVRVVDGSAATIRTTSVPFDRRLLRHSNFVDASSIVAPRADDVIFSRLPRAKGSARHEDWEFAYRLSRRGKVHHVPETTVVYLEHPDSHYRHVGSAP